MTKKEEKKNKKEKSNEDLEVKLQELKKERDEYLNGWKRARADFINYKKNEKSRIAKARKNEKKDIILEILSILDNFNIAEKNIDKEEVSDDYWSGLMSIKRQLENLLFSYGVEPIECLGEEFDPNIHEAVAMIEDENTTSEQIVEEVRKGYLLDGELLRPAKVKVAK